LILIEIRNISIRQTGSGINQTITIALWKNIFNVKYLENGDRYDDAGSMEVEQETTHGLSIGTMTFEPS